MKFLMQIEERTTYSREIEAASFTEAELAALHLFESDLESFQCESHDVTASQITVIP